MAFYETTIKNGDIKSIFTLSDIHADIHSLLIALRDCAQVIKKKDGIETSINSLDVDTELLLNMNLNDAVEYLDDLNFEWIKEDVYIVIVGDILDGYREGLSLMNPDNEYPQLEIKLLRFINKLDIYAKTKRSRVIKILGNHDLWALSTNDFTKTTRTRYIFPKTLAEPNYYDGLSRNDYFMYPNQGYHLLLEGGAGILIRINNNIFIHGQLLNKEIDYAYYDNINQKINNKDDPDHITMIEKYNLQSIENDVRIFDRTYAGDTDINSRAFKEVKGKEFCDNIKEVLKNFDDTPENLRIIIGHCPQSESSIKNSKNNTFTKIIKQPTRPNIEIIEPPANKEAKAPNFDKGKFIFGITMECSKDTPPKSHYVYHVDVGSSRGFDNLEETDKSITPLKENQYLLSRTPQVLEIYDNDNSLRIIRSTMKNTRIHLPRKYYETKIRDIPELNLDHKNYKNKYLKYKQKYLHLKKMIKY